MKNKIPFINPLPETNLAINAVIEAGIAVTKIYNEGFETKFKANNEPITDADIESNKIIHKIISASKHSVKLSYVLHGETQIPFLPTL